MAVAHWSTPHGNEAKSELAQEALVKSWMIFISLILSISCSKSRQQYYTAPTVESEIGIITKCAAKSEIQQIVSKYNGEFRIINETEKVFEVRGIDEKTIREELPHSRLKENKLYHSIVNTLSMSASNSNIPYTNLGYNYSRQDSHKNNFPYLGQIDALSLT